MKKVLFNRNDVFRFFGSVFFISSLVVAPFLPTSCKVTEESSELNANSLQKAELPNIELFRVSSSNCLELQFSGDVILSNMKITEFDDSSVFDVKTEDNKKFFITLPSNTQTGKEYILKATVSDFNGNSFDYEQKFIGYNNNLAKLLITEIRNKDAQKASKIEKTKVSYLEFYVLKGGSLSGLRVDFGYHSQSYKFPDIEVKKGEYIVLHLKSYGSENEGFINELEDNLTLSTAIDSSNSRDLWISGTDSYLTQTDVVAVVNEYTNTAIDGVITSLSGKDKWSRPNQTELVNLLISSNIWSNEDYPTSAIDSEGTSSVKTLSRQDLDDVINAFDSNNDVVIENGADKWFITTSATPGEKNSTEKYVKSN